MVYVSVQYFISQPHGTLANGRHAENPWRRTRGRTRTKSRRSDFGGPTQKTVAGLGPESRYLRLPWLCWVTATGGMERVHALLAMSHGALQGCLERNDKNSQSMEVVEQRKWP